MKKITLILITIISLAFLYSCEKQLKDPVLDMDKAVAPTLVAPENASEFILLEENADSVFATFEWTAATYDLSDIESVKYIIYMDLVDSSFMKMKEIGSTSETSFSITVAEMNSKLLSLGVEVEVLSSFEFKVYAYVNNETTYSDLYSTVFTFNATPYEASGGIEYPKLWVPGDYQGWAPADAPVIKSFNDDGIYTGYLYFPEGGTFEFKFTSDPDWDHTNYGFEAEGTLSIDAGAGNLTVPGPGGYQVVVDINNLTWSYTAESWGVIGEFTSWADDIDMEWDAANNYLTLTYDVPDLPDNRFKFRANDAWDINLGANDPPDGFLSPGGTDIPIPAPGVYTFNLILDGPLPTYEFIAQ